MQRPLSSVCISAHVKSGKGICMDQNKIEVENLKLSYGPREVIHGISFSVKQNEIFAIIGPAQSGKTSLLRCINRTIEFTPEARLTGVIKVDGEDIGRIKNIY